jgi:hypothetical protein
MGKRKTRRNTREEKDEIDRAILGEWDTDTSQGLRVMLLDRSVLGAELLVVFKISIDS